MGGYRTLALVAAAAVVAGCGTPRYGVADVTRAFARHGVALREPRDEEAQLRRSVERNLQRFPFLELTDVLGAPFGHPDQYALLAPRGPRHLLVFLYPYASTAAASVRSSRKLEGLGIRRNANVVVYLFDASRRERALVAAALDDL